MERAYLFPQFHLEPRRGCADLEGLLKVREKRVDLRREFMSEGCVLISLQLNIPGPHKRGALWDSFFDSILTCLMRFLEAERLKPELCIRNDEVCGAYTLIRVRSDFPRTVKKLALDFEALFSAAPAFDIDVYDRNGTKIEREAAGAPPRRCFVCGNAAFDCARSRRHDIPELLEHLNGMIRHQDLQFYAHYCVHAALRSMLYEVLAAPKPGLVDRIDNGVHHDMDIYLFTDSSLCLAEYFSAYAECSLRFLANGGREEAFLAELNGIGKRCEQEMFRRTAGVNTQMGLIFAFGLLIPAALLCRSRWLIKAENEEQALRLPDADEVGKEAGRLAEVLLHWRREEAVPEGARRSACEGYHICTQGALDVLESNLQHKRGRDEASVRTLLYLMEQGGDSNLRRKLKDNEEAELHKILRDISYSSEPFKALEKLTSFLLEKGASPGGSADLLAVTWFFYFLNHEMAG